MPSMFSSGSTNKGCLAVVALIVLIATAALCFSSEWLQGLFDGDDEQTTNQQHAPSEIVESTTWSVWNTGIETQLHDVYSPGEDEAWACGTDGTIVYTDDGGETWEKRPSGTGEDLDSIFFIDRETGFAAGSNGAFVKTTDAGKTWLPVDLPVPCMRCVYFWDSRVGYAVGNYGTLYRSEDGGDTWTQQDSGVEDEIGSVFVADENTAYFVTDGGLYGTQDGGQSWAMADIEGVTPNDVAVDHEGRVWVVADGGIWKSEDGAEFTQVPTDAAPGPFTALGVNGSTSVGAADGWVLNTTDGGETWTAEDSGLGAQVDGLFQNDLQAWVVSSNLRSLNARIGVKFLF